MQTEILLSTIDTGSPKPSFFEVCIMDQMNKVIQPAVRHLALYIAEKYSLDILVEQFENVYSIMFAYIQWNCLSKSGASLIESLYGLKRCSSSTHYSGGSLGTNAIGEHDRSMTSRQKVLSLAYIIVLPRMMNYLREMAKRVRERARAAADSVEATSAASDTNVQPATVVTRLQDSVSYVSNGLTQMFAAAFPYVEFAGDLSVFAYQLMYLCEKSEHHHPIFALLDMTLRRAKNAGPSSTSGSINDTTNVPTVSAAEVTPSSSGANAVNWPVTIILALVLAVRAGEYLRNNNATLSTHSLSNRLAAPVPLPPRPQPMKVGRGCVIPPIDATLCALCSRKRTNPCASTGGYVFCYLCILPYVRDHGKCPVTALQCREQDIIRLFEESNDD